jgi:UPF0755 protein
MKRGAYLILGAFLALVFLVAAALLFLRPGNPKEQIVSFEVKKGEGLRSISSRLEADGLVRNNYIFELYALLTGEARQLKPGTYSLSSLSVPKLVSMLAEGVSRETIVTIPEGFSIYDIDATLAAAGVLPQGQFMAKAFEQDLEGYLFPDTYRFYRQSDPETVIQRFRENFDRQLKPLLPEDAAKAKEILTMASILEKEVPEHRDRQVVTGLFLKRMEEGMPLQADATLCYPKRAKNPMLPCHPLTTLDTQIDSPYNTYLHLGLPPGPIGNPGISAVKAALSPVSSPYWYYLTDPVTKHTIFSKTLQEHENNRSRYLL